MTKNKSKNNKIYMKSYSQILIISVQIVFLQILNGYQLITEYLYVYSVLQDIEAMEFRLVM